MFMQKNTLFNSCKKSNLKTWSIKIYSKFLSTISIGLPFVVQLQSYILILQLHNVDQILGKIVWDDWID